MGTVIELQISKYLGDAKSIESVLLMLELVM